MVGTGGDEARDFEFVRDEEGGPEVDRGGRKATVASGDLGSGGG